jgi:5'-methylthioadenosine phosphorylase
MSVLGVIGGSGLYDLPDLQDAREETIDTPWGPPSAPIVRGTLHGTELAFLSRHGRGHTLSPSEVPYRANIYALRAIGVTHVLSVSAVGSLQPEHARGSAVVPDQIIDRTAFDRPRTFFDRGVVAHVGLADPFCASFRHSLAGVSKPIVGDVHDGGTYIAMEGPQFSTRAESNLHRSWGGAIVGMTAMPEARLAREAGLCYATLAMVTDYDVWHETEDDVSVEVVLATLQRNVKHGRDIVRELARQGLPPCESRCAHALDGAIITDERMLTEDVRQRIALFTGQRP